MTKRVGFAAALVLVQAACAGLGVVPARETAHTTSEVFNFDRFGAVRLFRGHGHPREVVLFVSGDSGWADETAALARHLADRGALVVGIDLPHYREELEKAAGACVSPSPDFENLSHYVQSKASLKKYLEPILVGRDAGAGWVYATLAESPDGLFKGALGMGFTPHLELKRALCPSTHWEPRAELDADGSRRGSTLLPATTLPGRWIDLQMGAADGMSAVDSAYDQLSAVRSEVRSAGLPSAVADLPLTVVPASGSERSDWFGIFLTGDGGWAGLDKGVSAELARQGIPIIGWDSLKYFWSRRTPDGASHDLDRVLRYYAGAWGRSHVLLIGYSQGADTMPFMINRLPPATKALVKYTTLLGISDNAVFEFHVATWLGTPTKGIPTGPELEKWSGSPYLCLYGEADGDAACAQLTGHDGTALELTGGHHFGGGYAHIAEEILARLPVE